MKKVLWAAVVFMLAGIGFAKVNAEESEYLIKTEPCEYQETLAAPHPLEQTAEHIKGKHIEE